MLQYKSNSECTYSLENTGHDKVLNKTFLIGILDCICEFVHGGKNKSHLFFSAETHDLHKWRRKENKFFFFSLM